MDSRLLVPASASLLDGWCGPVVLLDAHGGPALAGAHLYRDGRVSVFADWTAAAFDATTVCSLHGEIDRVSLDLSRAECRDRVARVFASVVLGLDARAGVCVAFVRVPRGGVAIVFAVVLKGEHVTAAIDSITSPALAGLDPNDDTRLPDGSRWVDAAALAAVAREALRG